MGWFRALRGLQAGGGFLGHVIHRGFQVAVGAIIPSEQVVLVNSAFVGLRKGNYLFKGGTGEYRTKIVVWSNICRTYALICFTILSTMSEPILGEPILLDVNSIPLVNVDNVQSVYSNNANAAVAPWDVRLIFSEVVTTSRPGEVIHALRANVVMHPAHAKALVGVLAKAIEAYEKQFGEIMMPSVVVQPSPAAKQS